MIKNLIVFIIIPNNSGSTIVHNAIAHGANVATLQAGRFKEGEKIVGMNFTAETSPMPVPFLYEPRWAGKGVTTPIPGLGRMWGAEHSEMFSDRSQFDWEAIRSIWLNTWKQHPAFSPRAVLLEKSPTSPAWAPMLQEEFPNSRFIISIRHPYTTIEGVRRRAKQNQQVDLPLELCTRHWMTTARLQISNIENIKPSIFFTYEQLCNNTEKTAQQVMEFLPEVKYPVFENIKSRNQDSLSRLSRNDISTINPILEEEKELLDYFGYKLIRPE